MKFSLKHLGIILLMGALGAVVYQFQTSYFNELLATSGIKRNWHLSSDYDAWPMGAFLGAVTGSVMVATRLRYFKSAARICMMGGLIAACILDAVIFLCWWFTARPDDYGMLWSTTENLLGIFPISTFGILWSSALMLQGWHLYRRATVDQ